VSVQASALCAFPRCNRRLTSTAAVIYAIYAPGIQFLGAPMAIMPLYVAVIALPDPIITGASVTGDLTAAVLVNRLLQRGKAHKAEA
jgi:Na+/H+-dicarboxylate symporter